MENQGVRLNKYIADSGFCSRREADRLIEQGRVQIDGRTAGLGDRVAASMRVTVDGKAMTRRAIKTSTYIMAPLMMGLAFVGEPFVKLFLTEKWLPAVPFMRVFCISFMFPPYVHLNGLYFYCTWTRLFMSTKEPAHSGRS